MATYKMENRITETRYDGYSKIMGASIIDFFAISSFSQ